jgi:hypothetical protein
MRKRATKQQIVISVSMLVVVAGACIWWWPHLAWAFMIARGQVRVPSVPVSELKAPGKTAGWYDCTIGPLRLRLPPEIVETAERSTGKGTLNFTLKSQELAVHVPVRFPAEMQSGPDKVAAEFQISPMHLAVETFRASTDDFRWSMSRSELRRHQILLNLAIFVFRRGGAMAVETRFDGPLEALLILQSRRLASFQWRTPSGIGTLMFSDKDQDLDMDVVRDICQSVSCDDSRLAAPYSKKELQELLDTIETRRDGS